MCAAEHSAKDGSTSFNNWRSVLSTNKAIWARGLTQEQVRLKGLRSGHYEGAVIDAPWIFHAPKLIVW